MSFLDLLVWIGRRNKHGSLTVETDRVVRTFRFHGRDLTSASSNLNEEHLGKLLLDRGLIDEDALQEAFRVQGDTGVLLGRILVMVGAIDDLTLESALKDKMVDGVADVLTWPDAVFQFDDAPHAETVSEQVVAVDLKTCIEMARQRAARWRDVKSVVADLDGRLWIADPDNGDGSDDTRAILDCIERGLSVRSIARELKESRLPVAERVVALVRAGVIGLERRTRSRTESTNSLSPDSLADAARGRAHGGDHVGAFALARKAVDKQPQDAAARALFAEMERALVAQLTRKLLGTFRVPKLITPIGELDQMGLSDTEKSLARRVDGHWDLLSLVRGSGIREADALIAFNTLADRGIISL